ncbi:MAG: N,N-dimethylformamidase beta subunit family domain-containing protein [Aggregatilineales bacterium]
MMRLIIGWTTGLISGLTQCLKWTVRLGVVCVLSNIWAPSLGSSGTLQAPILSLPGRSDCVSPANPVVAENCLPGTTDWIINRFSDELNGFAAPSSVNLGETVKFFVSARSPTISISIYRSGYYQGAGGRLVKAAQTLPGKLQPDCYNNLQTGLVSCSNWSLSTSLTIPAGWVSGIYMAKFSDSRGDNFAVFTVRDDGRKSDILYQQSLFTAQAYNKYGGKSVYDFNGINACLTGLGLPRAVQVSFDRPMFTGDMVMAVSGNGYFRAEYAMVRWLESQGYDVTYSNSLDTHRSGEPGTRNKLLDHRVFMSSGHDEYWTQQMRDAITAARDAGVNVAFFSGNTAYWRVRLEADPLTDEPDSVMTVYKTTQSGPPDPSGQPTTTWRDRQGVNNPENGLLGAQYVGDNDLLFFPLQVIAEQAHDRLYRHTGLSALPPHTSARIGDQLVGWEWDAVVNNGHTPAGLEILASSPVFGFLLQDDGNAANGALGTATAQVTRYKTPSGTIVFSTGTILWSWGLGAQGIAVTDVDPIIQQVTYNVLADMHVQPATPANDIILDSSSATDPGLSKVDVASDGGLDPIITAIRADPNAIYGMAKITWSTDVPTNGQVWLGDTPDHTITPSTPLKDFTRDHTITISLTSDFDKVIYFRVAGSNQTGQVAISDVRAFGTGLPSLRTSVHQSIDSAIINGRCWIQAHPGGTFGIGAVLVAAISLSGILTIRVIQHDRRIVRI